MAAENPTPSYPDRKDTLTKIICFLITEWARKDNRQLTEIALCFAPGGGFREEVIRQWTLADDPALFTDLVNVDKIGVQIVEIAEGEADAKSAGKHRFVVRTRQHLGARAACSFSLSPSYHDSDDVAIPSGGSFGQLLIERARRERDHRIAVCETIACALATLHRLDHIWYDADADIRDTITHVRSSLSSAQSKIKERIA